MEYRDNQFRKIQCGATEHVITCIRNTQNRISCVHRIVCNGKEEDMLLIEGLRRKICNDSNILKSDTEVVFPKMEKLSGVTSVSQVNECSRIGEGSGLTRNLPVRTDLPKCLTNSVF